MENIPSAYGFIHVHSTWSLQDAVAQIDDICKRASEMGAKGLTITDHGNCAGWIQFITTCQKYGLKSGPGVEGYYRFTPHGEYEGKEIQYVPPVKHAHFIFIAKNYEGYRQISHLMTAAQANCESIGGLTQPVFTKELIQEHIKEGNVFVTSACISGPLAAIYFIDNAINKQIASKRKFQAKYDIPDRENIIEKQQRIAEIDGDIKELLNEQDSLKSDSKISLPKLAKGLKTLEKECARAKKAALSRKREDFLTEEMFQQANYKDEQAAVQAQRDYDEALQSYQELERKKTYAAERIKEIKSLIAYLKTTKSVLKEDIRPYADSLKKYNEFQADIDALEAQRHSREEIFVMIRNELQWLIDTFGNDFFMEMQYHGMDEEAEVMPVLAQLAEEYHVPLVAANDSHLVTKEQANARHILLSLRYQKWANESPQDSECYMKSDEELSGMLRKILPEETVQEAMKGVRTIIDACDVTIPKETHYPKYKDDTGRTLTEEEAETLLRKLTEEGAKALFPDGLTQKYRERLDYELNTIISMGFVHYFLIVWEYVSYALKLADKTMGYGVGPGRGSGGGSLVLYLLRVTFIDPIAYGLIFERFLNPARVTMPDIDVDFSKEVREATIDYMRHKYGERLVTRIRTVMVMGAKDSLHSAARVVGYRESQTDKTMSKEQKEEANKRRKHIQTLGDRLASAIPDASTSLKDETVRRMLYDAVPDPLTKEIVDGAAEIEGCAKSFSIHAGGVVISDGEPIDSYIPVMRIVNNNKSDSTDDEMSMYDISDRTINESAGQLATACDMIQLEGTLKLLKFDFLGLNNLNVLSETKRRVYHNYGKIIDWNMLPIEPEVIKNIYSTGNTGNVFQAESEGMRNMFIRMEPKSLEDIILGIAAYRPGPMEFIPEIIKVKQGKQVPHYIIPELKDILAVTYGYPIYQEQLMDIFHKCAGFSLSEADNIRRLMSKKKKEEFVKFKPQFTNGLVKRGASEEEAEQLWNSLLGFASYAFNKSHAAVYAKISYATAYAKYHYPVEYMTSVLNWPKQRKSVPKLLMQCREMGIKILPPDITHSFMGFEDENGKILYGLSVIKDTDTKNVNEIIKTRDEGQFRSFQDFILRAHKDSSTTTRLIESGAFDSISHASRASLTNVLPQAVALKGEYETACQNNGPESAQAKAKKAELLELLIPDVEEDKGEKADKEHNALGAYITSHPMDEYENVYQDGVHPLRDVREAKKTTCVGVVSGLTILHRSADGAPFAKFTLEDKTDSLQCIMFTDAYAAQDKSILKNGMVVKATGAVKKDRNADIEEQTEEQAEQLKNYIMHVKSVTLCRKNLNTLLIAAPTEAYFTYFALPFLKKYVSEEGHPCILYEKDTGRTIPLRYGIDAQSMHENIPGISIKSQRHN